MKFSTKDIVQIYNSINKISEEENIEKAPIDIKFLLVRNARMLQPIWEEYMEACRELVANNTSPVEGTKDRQANPEQLEYINSEINKLEKLEIEVTPALIPLSRLDSLNLGIAELYGLYPIIDEEA